MRGVLFLDVPGCSWMFLDVPGCSWMFLAADCFSEGQEDFSGLSKKEKESLFSCVMYCPLAYWFKHFFQIRHLTPLHINSSLFAPPKWNTVNRSYAIPIAFLFHGQYSKSNPLQSQQGLYTYSIIYIYTHIHIDIPCNILFNNICKHIIFQFHPHIYYYIFHYI